MTMLTHSLAQSNSSVRTMAVREIVRQQARVCWFRIECERVAAMGLPDGTMIPSYRAVEAGSGRTLTPGWCDLSPQMARVWMGDHFPHAQEATEAEA